MSISSIDDIREQMDLPPWGGQIGRESVVFTNEGPIPVSMAPDILRHMNDRVEHPGHYTKHPSGVECLDITEHMNFCLGNVIKYVWRCDEKGDALEDLKKARFYLDREIKRREKLT
jgi:hypothetical protein